MPAATSSGGAGRSDPGLAGSYGARPAATPSACLPIHRPPFPSCARSVPRPADAPRMEEAYDAAVAQCGGLDAAKPKAVFEAMQATGEFPDLTLQAGGSLQAY